MSFSVNVDVTNPGQFFACCGLFELASRFSPDVTAHFADGQFIVEGAATLEAVLSELAGSAIREVSDDDKVGPLEVCGGATLRLDWWNDSGSGGSRLKTWAGQQRVGEIARAMHSCFRLAECRAPNLLDVGLLPVSAASKTEPFYFDSRRSENSHAREVGFSADALGILSVYYPATEFLALLGLQRCRPRQTSRSWFRYQAWARPIEVGVASAVSSCTVRLGASQTYRFENWSRSGYYKAFRRATPGDTEGE